MQNLSTQKFGDGGSQIRYLKYPDVYVLVKHHNII